LEQLRFFSGGKGNSPLDTCMSRSSPTVSSQISVTGAWMFHVTSAVLEKDPQSEFILYKIAGLLTVTFTIDM